MSAPRIHRSRFSDLDLRTLHDLLRLRVDVFVVEQECAYPEVDGLDTAPDTWHLWIGDDEVVAYLRILAGPRIGRVATSRPHRGRGLASALVEEALRLVGDSPVTLEAQSHLTAWYERFGFRQVGPEYVEDGIPHVPMRRG